MKTIQILVSVAILSLAVSCGSSKKTTIPKLDDSETRYSVKPSGVDTFHGVEYIWFEGVGLSDSERVAIRQSQEAARSVISQTIETAVKTESEDNTMQNEAGDAAHAEISYVSGWKQFSGNVQRGCMPVGEYDVTVTKGIDPTTGAAKRMYKVRSKVGLPYSKFEQLLNSAITANSEGLTGEQLDNFIEKNKKIAEEVKNRLKNL